ncbi:periplasmic nitrate reductase, NapE protein [uncultured Shewanella sp.]|uniref:periplasmic nitrate reductase, NapE protein n=1 Tax=uncultured Shewanella sp. TaxID=173975 RepID=UPI00262AD829|nr:periplasmic nitrate reductase, NapE protein [uncultured Shewanella sp.]
MIKLNTKNPQTNIKLQELKALAFIIFLLFPILSISSIGTYGLIIWMIQMFNGVASH